MKKILAVDLGASSGRVILGVYDAGKLSLEELHRFSNTLTVIEEQVCWDIDFLLEQIKFGCELSLEIGHHIDSLAIDTWGVDFVLIDSKGKRLGEAVSYRDTRTSGVYESLINELSKDYIYNKTGIQFLPFNTIFQLSALKRQKPEWLDDVESLLFIPDYLGFMLTGIKNCEYTNSSTSQLLNCQTGSWDLDLIDAIGLPSSWFIEPKMPNRIIGTYRCQNNQHIRVSSVASHDTASAILSLPSQEEKVAYISSGTWSLMGIESDTPINNVLAQQLNVTNEGGAERRFRVLKNIMGLWLIQNVQKELVEFSFADLVDAALIAKPFHCLIDPDHISFLNPSSMVEAIQTFCSKTKQPVPQTEGELARCIFESLAFQYRRVFIELKELKGEALTSVHIIGGGIQNKLLNQLCADACDVPVSTGPIEASAIGNLCGQLIALEEIDSVKEAREIVRRSFPVDHYQPNQTNAFLENWAEFERVCQF